MRLYERYLYAQWIHATDHFFQSHYGGVEAHGVSHHECARLGLRESHEIFCFSIAYAERFFDQDMRVGQYPPNKVCMGGHRRSDNNAVDRCEQFIAQFLEYRKFDRRAQRFGAFFRADHHPCKPKRLPLVQYFERVQVFSPESSCADKKYAGADVGRRFNHGSQAIVAIAAARSNRQFGSAQSQPLSVAGHRRLPVRRASNDSDADAPAGNGRRRARVGILARGNRDRCAASAQISLPSAVRIIDNYCATGN
ncbi:hypothetical protein A5745_03450 [Mycobacterium sp. IS-2888]|nr:hypothetical protein A5745_03450 [Mycobacterium sp. IS-2888]